MSSLDWFILIFTLSCVIIYGVWKGRGQTGSESYLLANKNMPWYTVLFGIMATQASAITFISGPGQAYTDGMRFVQYYFGLPLAMIVISAVFIPIFQQQRVYTAYQFLDKRFDRKTRLLTGFLFLFSRGISTGMSVYAPAIVLSAIFGWNIYLTNVLTGGFLILYTYTGGAKAVAYTQRLQFIIILCAMAFAGFWIVKELPNGVSFSDALYIAGKSEKLNVITTNFDWKDKYNLFSGIIGGFFLALSYFGTDQSQVGRYLSGKDLKQARMGILMNGMVKIPMQFLILLIGALLFSFFTFKAGPLFYNTNVSEQISKKDPQQWMAFEENHQRLAQENQQTSLQLLSLRDGENNIQAQQDLLSKLAYNNDQIAQQRKQVSNYIEQQKIPAPKEDTNYIFLYFVQHYLPVGLVGLLFAIIFLASWGSISAALNSLAASTLVDFHQVISKGELTTKQELKYGRLYTLLWGLFSIAIAMFATKMGSLIEAVNVLGSLFYGAILGVFLVAFFMKNIRGSAVFFATVVTQLIILVIYYLDVVGFLWFNVIGAILVMMLAWIFQQILPLKKAVDNG